MDVGFRHTGVAIWSIRKHRFIQTYVISTEKGNFKYVAESNAHALECLVSRLATIIGERNPLEIIAEMPVGSSRNAKAASCMSMAFAAIVSVSVLTGVPLRMVSPFDVKKLVDKNAGRKAVPKEQVISHIISIYGDKLLPDNANREHVADAMATLLAYQTITKKRT